MLASGLKQHILESLMFQYIPPDFLKVPKLNSEIMLHIHDGAKRKDAYLAEAQGLILMSTATLKALVGALADKRIPMDNNLRENFVGLAMEAAYLQAQHTYEQTQTRTTIKNDAVKQLLTDQTIAKYLFGKDLPEKLIALDKLKKLPKPLRRIKS